MNINTFETNETVFPWQFVVFSPVRYEFGTQLGVTFTGEHIKFQFQIGIGWEKTAHSHKRRSRKEQKFIE